MLIISFYKVQYEIKACASVPDHDKHASSDKQPPDAKCEMLFYKWHFTVKLFLSDFTLKKLFLLFCTGVSIWVSPAECSPANANCRWKKFLWRCEFNWFREFCLPLSFDISSVSRFPHSTPTLFHPRTPCSPSSKTSPSRPARYLSVICCVQEEL